MKRSRGLKISPDSSPDKPFIRRSVSGCASRDCSSLIPSRRCRQTAKNTVIVVPEVHSVHQEGRQNRSRNGERDRGVGHRIRPNMVTRSVWMKD